jgi:hypothetical protein
MTKLSTEYCTVVYRGILPGDDARALGSHPLMVAMSWSNALYDRDAAIRDAESLKVERDALRGLLERARDTMHEMRLRDEIDAALAGK